MMSNKQKAGVRWLDYVGFFEPAFYKKCYIQGIKAEAIAENERVVTVSIYCTIWLENGCDINRWISYNIKLDTVPLNLDEFNVLKPEHLIALVQQNYYPATAFGWWFGMNIDRIERLISEFISELEDAAEDGNYHLLNAIDNLTAALMELEELDFSTEVED